MIKGTPQTPILIGRIKTPHFHGFSVQYSPFFPDRLAIGTGANYGIAGNGRLFIAGGESFGGGPGESQLVKHFDTQDGIIDVCWHERHEQQILSAQGDGSIKVWDLSLPEYPIRNYHEHSREVMSISYNPVSKATFISGSWDTRIKIWDAQASKSIATFQEHAACVYEVAWSPREADSFASCSGDGTIKLWDARHSRSMASFRPHTGEILSLDWNKYLPHVIVSGSVDKSVRVHDTRNLSAPLHIMTGHGLAVRRVRTSPHSPSLLASVSYDRTMKLWSMESGEMLGRVVTCGWDEGVVFHQLP